jgi:tRNA pseudouridine38-40 synthase
MNQEYQVTEVASSASNLQPPASRFIALTLAYDGTHFCGSQRQANGPSVQGELERALEVVLKVPATVSLAGRTDAGVHALGQVGRFATENQMPAEKFVLALNRVLEKSVRIFESREVDESFHPRFSAKSRVYRYWINNAAVANPSLRMATGHIVKPLAADAMRRATSEFLGSQDFAAWQSAGSPNGPTIREVMSLEVREVTALGTELLEIEIEANAFLYQMVRNIVGALIKVGQGDLTAEDIRHLTADRDRTKCPPPAPPQGLCLVEVKY